MAELLQQMTYPNAHLAQTTSMKKMLNNIAYYKHGYVSWTTCKPEMLCKFPRQKPKYWCSSNYKYGKLTTENYLGKTYVLV